VLFQQQQQRQQQRLVLFEKLLSSATSISFVSFPVSQLSIPLFLVFAIMTRLLFPKIGLFTPARARFLETEFLEVLSSATNLS
jgi:hypothetical protein